MIPIRKLQIYLSKYDAGDRSEELQHLLFKAVGQTRADNDDIEEMEDIGEAVDYLKRRLEHGHYRSAG